MIPSSVNIEPHVKGATVAITGGTGSLGKILTKRLLALDVGRVIVLSRDEAKQHFIREGESYGRDPRLSFVIGDVRDAVAVDRVVRESNIVVNAAALKQVPACEYTPWEAVRTNVEGAENIIRSVERCMVPPSVVVGVSTDKACKPVNAMGMTKALQERIFIQGNLRVHRELTRILCVRYGNVLASRGSVIPLFHDQIARGGPVTITTADMTRFLLSLDHAVETIFAAIVHGMHGETWVPRVPSALVTDVARALIGDKPIETRVTGIRPGEKIHEIMISEEESPRAVSVVEGWYAIRPSLPELVTDPRPTVAEWEQRGARGATQGRFYGNETKQAAVDPPVPPRAIEGEYSSRDSLMTFEQTVDFLGLHGLIEPHAGRGEFLR